MGDKTAEEVEAIKKSGLFFIGLDKLVRGIKLYEGQGALVQQLLKDGYTKAQGLIRGADEAVDYVSDDDVIYKEERQKRELDAELKNIMNQQSINATPQINVPIFDVPEDNTETLSPSILPNEKDREIALRDMSSGIGSLA